MSTEPADIAAPSSAHAIAPDSRELGMSPDDFRGAFRHHPAGVALITADDGDHPVAMTATSVFSVSATPPLLVFSASELSSATPTLRRADTVVVHLLGADDLELAILGSTSGVDRFADRAIWSRLPSGEPFFVRARSWIRGRVVNKLEAGGATLFVILALDSSTTDSADGAPSGQPLVYHNRTWHALRETSKL